jgi:hypothetical protein
MVQMTLRERLMTVIRGGRADQVPFTICQCLLPDSPAGRKLHMQGLTPVGWTKLFKEKTDNSVTVSRKEIINEGKREVVTEIITPVGRLMERAGFDPTVGSRWILEHLIKSPEDFIVMKYVFNRTTYEPYWEDYILQDKKMGENGIIYGQIMPIPVQWLLTELMGTQVWSESVMLYTDEFEELLESLTGIYKKLVDIAADGPAEVIWLEDNITGTIMSPVLWDKYCKPIYDYICTVFKQSGKKSVAHYDGENRPLIECIKNTKIDVIEAFTPPPMGNMTVAEARKAWPQKVLFVNVPENIYHLSSEVIGRHITEYMEQAQNLDGFILGCTEDFEMKYFEHAFTAIAAAMKKFQGLI